MDQNRHRRSIRLKGYDYTQAGAYYVTLLTRNRIPLLGQLAGLEMVLSSAGQLCKVGWLLLPNRFPALVLDEYIIMPDHLHGIIFLSDCMGTGEIEDPIGPANNPRAHTTVEAFSKPVPGSLPTIIRSYKAYVTTRFRHLSGNASAILWQRNYCEHVIRNEDDLDRIRNYIRNNPLQSTLRSSQPSRSYMV